MRLLLSLLAFASLALAQSGRIVSAAPSSTEVLFALGLGERVVGVTSYCRFPPEARRLPKIGSYMRPNAEAILRLKPDLVILQTENAQIEERLARVGVRTVVVKNRNLRELLDSILVIGRAAGAEARAVALTSRIEQELDAIRRKTAGRARRSLLFIVGRTPGRLEGLIAAGRGSHLHELIEIAGGRNALGDVAVPYPRISLETTLRLDPDVVVDMGDMGDTTAVTESHKRAVVRLWSKWSSLQAARKNRVYAVASDIYVVPGPRVVEAVRAFARMLHPEANF